MFDIFITMNTCPRCDKALQERDNLAYIEGDMANPSDEETLCRCNIDE